MVRSRLLRLSFHMSVLLIALLVVVTDASANARALLSVYDGITLLYVREEDPSPALLDALEPADAFERITEALILIKKRSRRHYAAIKALDGAVYIRYQPYGFTGDYASSSLALFRQGTGVGELDAASDRNYVAVLGRYVVQWPAAELAGIIVHELVGHGTQAKEGRLRTMTDLDRECEAQLHQYRAQHDLGVDHLDTANVYFRNYLEGTWCRDFIWFLKDQAPSQLALWRAPVLDAGRLLALFHKYQTFEPPPSAADEVVAANGASNEVLSAHPLPPELRK